MSERKVRPPNNSAFPPPRGQDCVCIRRMGVTHSPLPMIASQVENEIQRCVVELACREKNVVGAKFWLAVVGKSKLV